MASKVCEILSWRHSAERQRCNAPQSWSGKADNRDKLFRIRPLVLHGDPTADSHSSVELLLLFPLAQAGSMRHQEVNMMWQASCCKPGEKVAKDDGSPTHLCASHSALPHSQEQML